MTQFDEFIKAITEGLGDMGKGPMASGGIKPAATQQAGQGVQASGMSGGTQMKHSGAASGTNGVAATPSVGGIKGDQAMAQKVIGMHKQDPQGFQQQLTNLAGQDPDTFNLVLQSLVPGPPPQQAQQPTV
jgi:hypothetical protein